MQTLENALRSRFPQEIVDHLLQSYKEVEREFSLSRWKTSELDAGHFVESARRAIEHELFGTYKPFSASLGSFSPVVIQQYEQASGHESFRLIIPRVLYSVYCVRNKRGVGHIGEVSPNHMDATYVLASIKWCMAELVRLSTSLSPAEATSMVDQIVERQVEAIWDDGETFMIMSNISASEKVLIALYKRDNTSDSELQELIEYTNRSRFKSILKKLKADKFIDYRTDGRCKLSPLGAEFVEERILNSSP